MLFVNCSRILEMSASLNPIDSQHDSINGYSGVVPLPAPLQRFWSRGAVGIGWKAWAWATGYWGLFATGIVCAGVALGGRTAGEF